MLIKSSKSSNFNYIFELLHPPFSVMNPILSLNAGAAAQYLAGAEA